MKVSVIIPVYRAEPYIEACLDSLLAGGMDGLEIIAVDDRSPDRSGEILDRYAAENKIRAIHMPENGGPSKARNAGLDAATGEYIGFVDADDWVEPDMFSRLYDAAKEHDADIVFCNLYRNQSEKMKKYLPNGLYTRTQIEETIYPLLISNLNEQNGKTVLRGSVCVRIFRRSLIEKRRIRFDNDLMYNEDGLFNIEAAMTAQRYLYLGDDYLYHNRYVAGSLTKRYVPNLWDRQRELVDKLCAVTRDSVYDFSRQIAKKAFEIAVYCVENECKDSSPLSAAETQAALRRIVRDPVLRAALKQIDAGKLSRIHKGYYRAFQIKNVWAVKAIAAHRDRKHKEKMA